MKHFNYLLRMLILSVLFQSNVVAQSLTPYLDLKDAYIYGFPLVMMELTKRQMTNVETPNELFAPVNQLGHTTKYLDPDYTVVVAPNADTYYSSAWLDLSDGPFVVGMPDTHGRYYLLPTLDAWTNVFASPGSRTTGTGAQTFLLTGPSWSGVVPAGMTELKSPTEMAWFLGRIQVNSPEDGATIVKAIQDSMFLVPLSEYGNPSYNPPLGTIDPNVSTTVPSELIFNLSVEDYFNLLNQLLLTNPPASYDAQMVAKMSRVGVGPGRTFKLSDFSLIHQVTLRAIPSDVKTSLAASSLITQTYVNGWGYLYNTGSYGSNYLLRAYVAYYGLGANLMEDALYASASSTQDLISINGSIYNYSLHFDADELPPVNAFWSLCAYNNNTGLFVENEIGRYSIGSRDSLLYNADGSLDLYMQTDSPGAGLESNWLPIPDEAGRFVMRFYWPKDEMLNREWHVPALCKTLKIFARSFGDEVGNDDIEKEAINVYPNPVSNILYVGGNSANLVSIFDTSGKLVFEQENINSIPVNTYPNGMYIVKVRTATGSFTYKVIKN